MNLCPLALGIVVRFGFLLAFLPAAVLYGAEAPKIETRFIRLTLDPGTGHCEVLDKEAGVTWRPDPKHARFGEVTLDARRDSQSFNLEKCTVSSEGTDLLAAFSPVTSRRADILRVRVKTLPDQRSLEFSYEADPELEVDRVSLLEDLLVTTDTGKGYVIVPVREGLLVPSDSGLNFTHRFDTYAYEGCHMEMLGVVQNGAAALITWQDPYVAAQLKSVTNTNEVSGAHQRVSPSLTLSKSARTFRIQFLGKGDYVTIARAYRQIAQERGWLVSWEQKLKAHPERAKLFGAANFKLWSALERHMNEESTKEESVHVNWTFDEAAEVAEHLKRDLKLEKVLFTVGGWIHRGYDNQHPDILPTAPECGGDVAFANCARRVMDLGYLFCLHDNYQDIYRDSPSWDEKLIMKTENGKLARGGHWAGGLAFLTCSQTALGLAQRPQNLPAVKKLANPNSYFIDTTYAAGLQECYDPNHALTRADDIKWKQALSDYARDVFGVFGSECGREWAIPHSDFFEGLTGVSGHYYHDANLPAKLGATVVPLFELVYRDCIAMYGKYGYDPKTSAEYVLHHISIARPLNHHSIPHHLYWKQHSSDQKSADDLARVGADPALFTRADNGWGAELHPMDRFVKNTYEVLSPLNEITARMQMTRHEFLSADRKVRRTVFGNGADAVEVIVNAGATNYICSSKFGGEVILPPFGFVAESPTFVAFHALRWNGVEYQSPVLFTLRSQDKKPLSQSTQIRVFHAFGEDKIRIGTQTRQVQREAILQ
ncbi:MAG TPA: DUF5696 domain-containing protein [Candidatus Limnocylindrales bacterium]|nr:DUF5696 domain-containing protein [Candidatus Limnocylindrales bacterium]